MNKKLLGAGALLFLLVGAAGNTHRILPASADDCQTDISHLDHISELPMFHCIGHKEYRVASGKDGLEAVESWFHLHPWMTQEWHEKQGFRPDHSAKLIKDHTSTVE